MGFRFSERGASGYVADLYSNDHSPRAAISIVQRRNLPAPPTRGRLSRLRRASRPLQRGCAAATSEQGLASGATYQFAQSVRVPDDERAARGIKDPCGAPERELFIDRFPAGADHLSQIVLRYWYGDGYPSFDARRWSVVVMTKTVPPCRPWWLPAALPQVADVPH